MKGLIFNNKATALSMAKAGCINQAEAKYGIRLNESLVINSNAWTIESCEATCICGSTAGIRAILFGNYLTDEMLDSQKIVASIDELAGEQFISAYGYCESCGSENPMP